MSYVTFSFDFINAIKLSLAVFFDYFNEKIILKVSGDTYIWLSTGIYTVPFNVNNIVSLILKT